MKYDGIAFIAKKKALQYAFALLIVFHEKNISYLPGGDRKRMTASKPIFLCKYRLRSFS